jgi:hypothetical protein
MKEKKKKAALTDCICKFFAIQAVSPEINTHSLCVGIREALYGCRLLNGIYA